MRQSDSGVKTGTKCGGSAAALPGLGGAGGAAGRLCEVSSPADCCDRCMPAGDAGAFDRRDEQRAARTLAGAGNGAAGLAREVKERIASTVGECMKSSIGIAPNGFLAKTASDMQKPNGLVVLDEADLPAALFGSSSAISVASGNRGSGVCMRAANPDGRATLPRAQVGPAPGVEWHRG